MAPAGVELAVEGGITYELKLSAKPSDNNGGYEGVVKAGNLFHAKPTLERGGGQTMLPGTGENAGKGCRTAREAALRIAEYKAAPYPLVKKERAPKGDAKVRLASPHSPRPC